MAEKEESAGAVCPVDHKTRAAWLEQAKHQPAAAPIPAASGQSCDSNQMDQSVKTPINPHQPGSRRLDTAREVSTIPRLPLQTTASSASRAANNEQETGSSSSGHWIYPSERQFFDALQRKKYAARAEDMRAIVPIHNAVNEKAWQEILAWEKGRGGDTCGGPRLESFSGLSTQMTPKARLNTILGYQAPFDRHDWVVDRCGTKVEYVIDFYSGRDEGKPGKPLNFYLDVRPKLNSVEGWKMRITSLFGL